MAFEKYVPQIQSSTLSLYAVPLRLIDGAIKVKRSDVPDRFRPQLDSLCTHFGMNAKDEYIAHSIFVMFMEVNHGYEKQSDKTFLL